MTRFLDTIEEASASCATGLAFDEALEMLGVDDVGGAIDELRDMVARSMSHDLSCGLAARQGIRRLCYDARDLADVKVSLILLGVQLGILHEMRKDDSELRA